jgi:hypothetical protein
MTVAQMVLAISVNDLDLITYLAKRGDCSYPVNHVDIVDAAMTSETPGMVRRLSHMGLIDACQLNADAMFTKYAGKTNTLTELLLCGMDVDTMRCPVVFREALHVSSRALIEARALAVAFGIVTQVEQCCPARISAICDEFASGREVLAALMEHYASDDTDADI